MLKLINIKKNNNIISADYDPEGSGLIGSLSVDGESGNVIEANLSELDNVFPIYFNHAADELRRLIEKNSNIKERLVMWY